MTRRLQALTAATAPVCVYWAETPGGVMGLRAWLWGGFNELAELSHVLSHTIWATLVSTGIMVMHRHSLHTGGSLSIAATWHELGGVAHVWPG